MPARLDRSIAALSAFVRPEAQLQHQTTHGAIVTLCGCALALILFSSELYQLINATPTYEMGVAAERHTLLDIHLDITFPHFPCALLSVDMRDLTGEGESDAVLVGIQHMWMHKQRLTVKGRNAALGEYHLPAPDLVAVVGGQLVTDSRKHIQEMDQELDANEGCRLHGTLQMRKLSGGFRITAHIKDFLLLSSTRDAVNHAIQAELNRRKRGGGGDAALHTDFSKINMTHHINALRIGPDYPGRVSALDRVTRIVTQDYGTFRYFLQIVPTTYVSALWYRTSTFVYSVTEYFVPGPPAPLPAGSAARGAGSLRDAGAGGTIEQMPALDFRFSVSPIAVKVWYPGAAPGHFLTRLCAVLGGCFALTQWADGLMHYLLKPR